MTQQKLRSPELIKQLEGKMSSLLFQKYNLQKELEILDKQIVETAAQLGALNAIVPSQEEGKKGVPEIDPSNPPKE